MKTAILVGAGNRGINYSNYMKEMNGRFNIIGVAEPNATRREFMKNLWDIEDKNCFADFKEIFSVPKFADCAIIATQDAQHCEMAIAAIDCGYTLLLEKPIAPTAEECKRVADHAEKKGVDVIVCHVLRYTQFFSELKEITESGELGELVSIVHNEDVGNIHHSHSFVRGNWGNSKKSSPMILAKSCHDLDILAWLVGKKCTKISSFGSLKYFNEENAPEGAPKYCLEGCPAEATCPYHAKTVYMQTKAPIDLFRSVVVGHPGPTDEEVIAAIEKGPYGRCVFRCDNDVVDHQTVSMEFEGGVTAVFTMCSFTPRIARTIKLMYTNGIIEGDLEGGYTVTNFTTGETKERKIIPTGRVGHGGGDEKLVHAFYDFLCGEYKGNSLSGVRVSCDNHLLCFVAEESRVTGKTIEL